MTKKKTKAKAKLRPQDKTEQNKTKSVTSAPKRNPQTGLTAIQEQCASLLASGEKISKVAEMIHVSRSMIYQWNTLITFQCYTNQLRDEMQRHMNQTLLKLAGEALNTIQKSLKSDNENLRVKSAMWLIDKITKVEVGECDPFEAVRKESFYSDPMDFDSTPTFSQYIYEKKLKELGLKETKEEGKLYEEAEDTGEEYLDVEDIEIGLD